MRDGLAGGRDGLDQRTHLLDATFFDVSQGHGHHDGKGQADPGLHLCQAADEMPLEAEAVVDAVIDPFQGAAPIVAAVPTGAAMWGRHEDASIMLVEADPHDASIVPRRDPAGLVAAFTTLALQSIGGGRAAVFECIAIGLEALEGQIALFSGLRANAVDTAFFGMDNGVDPLRKQRAGNRLAGIVVGVLLLFAPQFAGVDERADTIGVPQQGLGLGTVQTAISCSRSVVIISVTIPSVSSSSMTLARKREKFQLLGTAAWAAGAAA